MYYQNAIRETLARIGRIGTEPRHVEAWMRSEYGTLDHLSRDRFESAVRVACHMIDSESGSMSEDLAQSFGIRA